MASRFAKWFLSLPFTYVDPISFNFFCSDCEANDSRHSKLNHWIGQEPNGEKTRKEVSVLIVGGKQPDNHFMGNPRSQLGTVNPILNQTWGPRGRRWGKIPLRRHDQSCPILLYRTFPLWCTQIQSPRDEGPLLGRTNFRAPWFSKKKKH